MPLGSRIHQNAFGFFTLSTSKMPDSSGEGLVVTGFSTHTFDMGPPLFLQSTVFTEHLDSFYLVLPLMKNNQLFFHMQQLYPMKTVKISILLKYEVSMPFKCIFLDPFLIFRVL